MTVLKTAYDTLAGAQRDQSNADLAIRQAILSGDLATQANVVMIDRLKTPAIEAITQLIYPKVLLANEQERVFVDMRPFMTISTGITNRKIINQPEYDFHTYWAAYQYRWVSEAPTNLRSLPVVAMAAYANWIANSIVKRLTMEHHQVIPTRIIAAYYYACQFQNGELAEPTRLSIYRMIARALNMPIEVVFDTLGDGKAIDSLQAFCDTLRLRIESPRLLKLSPGFIMQLVLGSWFGVNAREIVAAAIEHPPTWLALVTQALNSSIYRSTQIAKSVEQAVGRNNHKETALAFKRAAGVEQHLSI